MLGIVLPHKFLNYEEAVMDTGRYRGIERLGV